VTQYHVTLNGQGYVLDLTRYRKRIRDPFVARQSSTARGAVAIADLRGPEQVLALEDWSGGEGHVVYDSANPGRFRSGSGVDGYTVPGTLRLGPHASSVGTTDANAVRSLASFKGKLYAGAANGKVYSWDGTTFAQPHTVAGGPSLTAMGVFLDELYVGNVANGNVDSFNGTAWTATRFTAGGPVFALRTHFRQAAQYLYIGASGAGTNGVGRLYYWDGSALSAGQFDPEDVDPSLLLVVGHELVVAGGDSATLNWSLYAVDDGGAGGTWRRYRALAGELYPYAGTHHDDDAYIGDLTTGRLYRWDGSALALAFQVGGAPGYAASGALVPASWRGAVWTGVVEAGGTLGVLRYDPRTGARHRALAGLTGTDWRSSAVWADRLYLGSSQAGAAKLFRVDPTLYGGSGTLTSGLIDCGLPGVSKLFRSVTLVCEAIVSGHSVQVEYQLEDTGAWTSLGTLSAVGATTATYSFGANVTGRQIALRITLTGVAGSASSPVVRQVALRYVPRPTVMREWDLGVVLEGTAELPLITLDSAPEPLTGAELTTALWSAAGAVGPVTLVDLDGLSYSVYVEDVREEVARLSQRKGYQRLGVVRLVEAA
jgi:hypothetical protein